MNEVRGVEMRLYDKKLHLQFRPKNSKGRQTEGNNPSTMDKPFLVFWLEQIESQGKILERKINRPFQENLFSKKILESTKGFFLKKALYIALTLFYLFI